MHSKHVALLVKVLLHERISLVLWNVHILEDLMEPLVDFLDRELENENLNILHVIVVVLVGR